MANLQMINIFYLYLQISLLYILFEKKKCKDLWNNQILIFRN